MQVICQVTDVCWFFYSLTKGWTRDVGLRYDDSSRITLADPHIFKQLEMFLTLTPFLLCTFILAATSWYSEVISNQSDVTRLSHPRWVRCLWELWTPGYFGDGNVLTVCVFASVVFILIKSSAAADFLGHFILSGSVARLASLHKTVTTDEQRVRLGWSPWNVPLGIRFWRRISQRLFVEAVIFLFCAARTRLAQIFTVCSGSREKREI